jgi:hypothetical protein
MAACGAAACGSSTSAPPPDCALDPTGTFTFHVRNVGDQRLTWDLGCMKKLPITLHLPEGDLPIGPGSADYCELTCEQIYSGWFPGACTDCGPGYSGSAAPGASGDIAWDRRVYTRYTFDLACRVQDGAQISAGATCAFGHAVAPSATQSGTITICPGYDQLGTCYLDTTTAKTVATRNIEFTVDTTGSEATIDVQ